MPDEEKPDPSLYESSQPPEGSESPEEPAAMQEGAGEGKAAPAATMVAESEDDAADSRESETPDEGDAAAESKAEAAMQAMLQDTPGEVSGESRQDLDDEFPDLSRVGMDRTIANRAEFQQLSAMHDQIGSVGNIDLLLDVKMPVAIELGRTELPISEILSLGPGSVVELDKLAGEPVDLLVNGKIIARGEVVVVDENFGVRITMLMSPQERLKSLG